jgi:hypothetical protein
MINHKTQKKQNKQKQIKMINHKTQKKQNKQKQIKIPSFFFV